jgi:hypothetical protein
VISGSLAVLSDFVTPMATASTTAHGRDRSPLPTPRYRRRDVEGIGQERGATLASGGTAMQPVERIQRLTRLKGIGAQIATVLGTEVFYRDFGNRRCTQCTCATPRRKAAEGPIHNVL